MSLGLGLVLSLELQLRRRDGPFAGFGADFGAVAEIELIGRFE